MFESNFPMEKSSCSYGVLWNACKRMVQALSRDEQDDLFAGTACRAYRLSLGREAEQGQGD
jgi:predicted TIM-barrel fold metal-dependent hydrolase